MKKQTILFATAILSLTALFSSCKKEEVKKFSEVNFVHASPNAPAFLVHVDTELFLPSALKYGENAGYRSMEAGARKMKFEVYGFDTVAYTLESTFKEKTNYSMILVDSFTRISALMVEDDLGTPQDGRARLRFIQLSPNAPKVDVLRSVDSSLVFEDVAYKDIKGFQEFEPGVYDWEVRIADSNSNYILTTIPTFVLNNGKSYTIYTQGFLGSGPKTKFTSNFFMNK